MELTQIVKLQALGSNPITECTSHCCNFLRESDVSINIIRQSLLLMKEQIFSLNFVLKESQAGFFRLFTFSKEAQKTSRPDF